MFSIIGTLHYGLSTTPSSMTNLVQHAPSVDVKPSFTPNTNKSTQKDKLAFPDIKRLVMLHKKFTIDFVNSTDCRRRDRTICRYRRKLIWKELGASFAHIRPRIFPATTIHFYSIHFYLINYELRRIHQVCMISSSPFIQHLDLKIIQKTIQMYRHMAHSADT